VAEPTSPHPDPMAAWRLFVTQAEQQWNAFFNQAMGSDQYSQSLGRLMETYAAMQKTMADTMSRYLGALNMPSRADIMTLGDRLAMIEDRLAGIERMLAGMGAPSGAVAAAPAARPPRTKQPPSDARPAAPPDGTTTA
jgi:Poly(R)-hydroxyalkanoic acid synthase subunit (PHA_synth_III_E)